MGIEIIFGLKMIFMSTIYNKKTFSTLPSGGRRVRIWEGFL
jgi:hypothetical protein